MQKNDNILIAGISGLVGSAISRSLLKKGYSNITGTYLSRYPVVDPEIRLEKIDFCNQKATEDLFEKIKPDYIFLTAAKVGGIMANNTYRADFIHKNLLIHNNIIHTSYLTDVKKLLYLGSTCIYPRNCPQPIREEYLLTGPLEYTNEPYAIAKIAGLKMCENYNLQYGTNYISVMPTNLYGPNDNFDLESAHVLPALLRKIHLAKLLQNNDWNNVVSDLDLSSRKNAEIILDKYGITGENVEIWGTGTPMREFLYVDDMADACIFIMEKINFSDLTKDLKEIRNCHINIGSGVEVSIRDLAILIKEIVGYNGTLSFNTNKPDGTPRKLTDVTKLHNLGWKHNTPLRTGLKKVYKWYISVKDKKRTIQ